MRFIWLLFILFALLALACGGTTELPTSAPTPTPSPTRQAPVESFHDLIWIDLQPFGDASGNRLLDLQTKDWYRWQKELGGYAPPDGELSDFTLVLTDDRYGLLPAPTPQFQITRTIETENTRIGWGMSMGSNYVLLQRTIQERDEQNNLSTAHQLFYTRNEQDAPTIPLPDVVPLTTQSHQLLRHVTWSPDYQRLVLQQPQNNTLYLLDIPTAQWRTLDLSETQYDIIWSPDSQSLALRRVYE